MLIGWRDAVGLGGRRRPRGPPPPARRAATRRHHPWPEPRTAPRAPRRVRRAWPRHAPARWAPVVREPRARRRLAVRAWRALGPAAKLLRRHPELHRLLPPTLGPQRPGQRAPLGHKAFKRQAVEVVGIHTAMVPALWCRRAKACGTDGSPASTLELTRALLLAVSRHLCEEEVSMRQGGWQHTIGPELGGRTLGLVG